MLEELPPIKDVSEQTEEEKKLVAHVKSKVEESRSSATRISAEGIWMTNIAYLLGVTNVKYNTQTRQFQPLNRGASYLTRNNNSINKILPTIQNRLSRLCKNAPRYDVRPESMSNDDKEAARVSLHTLTALWDEMSINKKRLALYMWVQQTGHAWAKIAWDDTLGKLMVDPGTGETIGYEGNVRTDICSPFEIFPDPLAKSDEDVYNSWLIQAKVRKLDYFKSHYPDRGGAVKEESAWLLSAQYEQRINSINTRSSGTAGQADAVKNTAIELAKYEAPSKDYPNGRMIITANGVLLANKELPAGEIPFAMFCDVIIGGKLYPESLITHLRPVQDQYNELIRRRSEWTRQLLAGKYSAPRGGGLAQESLNDQSGEVVYYTHNPALANGGAPVAMQVPVIPQYAYTEEDKLIDMINDISGISEISRGDIPSSGMPAVGMQLLQEQDATRIGVVTEQHEWAWARIGRLILKYVQKYYKLPRKLKIAGPDLEYAVKEVSGDDLRDNTDVIVIRGSTLPNSKTLERQDIMNTYQMGLLGVPSDPKVQKEVFKRMEYGDFQGLWEKEGLIAAQIARGTKALESGQLLNVSEFDDHVEWIDSLNKYRISDKFDSLDPTIQNNFIQTMEAHVRAMVTLANPSAQFNPPQAPPPPPPGAEGPPPEGGGQPPMPPPGAPPHA